MYFTFLEKVQSHVTIKCLRTHLHHNLQVYTTVVNQNENGNVPHVYTNV